MLRVRRILKALSMTLKHPMNLMGLAIVMVRYSLIAHKHGVSVDLRSLAINNNLHIHVQVHSINFDLYSIGVKTSKEKKWLLFGAIYCSYHL